jgi:NADH-quinone oxidoreductase subunit M
LARPALNWVISLSICPTLYKVPLSHTEARWLFAGFAIAFAIKVPMWPVHTWLPDAHTDAPTAGSVMLAGIMLKMGTYGFLRFAIPLFPEVAIEATPIFMALAVIGIIYGALVAMVQPDLKRIVAYSSVSHLGFVMLGIFALNPQGLEGATYQMLNHGVSTGALFLLIGMIYLRRHTRDVAEFGGLWKAVPIYAAIFMFVMLSSIGLPGLNGFRRRVPHPARHFLQVAARGRGSRVRSSAWRALHDVGL